MKTMYRNPLRRVRTVFLEGVYPDGPLAGRTLAAARLPRGSVYQVWIGGGDDVAEWARRARGKLGGTVAVGAWQDAHRFELSVERWRPLSAIAPKSEGKRVAGLARPFLFAMAAADRYFIETHDGASDAEIVVRDASGERWPAGTWRDFLPKRVHPVR
ncbi:hypothetical protein [Alicyclobacillus acidocaldarius]|uniref:Uncharacterized protein n=1 Tax=Alicyclobacillus acidocaldarius (strain Tc-4-1) TaxID=1048834 RepID=F8IFE2_ALIAT|nr:hypothetical protein [Alicyclobacillus acidocaldarius]AEJ42844.1 hypothetical protein TC41_0891 [Alicyclobacillus acidocaldarius subsp. acidocaldarius Tc-4-1]